MSNYKQELAKQVKAAVANLNAKIAELYSTFPSAEVNLSIETKNGPYGLMPEVVVEITEVVKLGG